MISPPSRFPASTRAASASASSAADPAEPTAAGETADTAIIDARLTALAARASPPEDEALERERQEFDFVTEARAETQRELNTLRDMAMEQMKVEDELLKKWIALI
jgi:hypothetical protein